MAEKKESVYTPAIVKALSEVEGLNWEKAKAFGEENGLKPMGVVICAKRNKIAYTPQERKTKSGEKIISKATLVANIAEKFGIAVTSLAGLEKSTKNALEALEAAELVEVES